MRPLHRGLVGGLLLAGVVAWLWTRSAPEGDAPSVATDSNPPGTAHSAETGSPVPEAPPLLAEAASRERVESEVRRAFGKVVAEDGKPVPEATVSWVALLREDEDTLDTRPFSGDGWWRMRRESLSVVSDSDGRFEFFHSPDADLEHGSVLIGSKDGYAKKCLFVSGGTEMGKDELLLVLEEAPSLVVRVVNATGLPVVGATVHRVGASGTRGNEHRHERHVQDEVRTGAGGLARLPALKGEQAVWAEMGETVSAPWQGRSPKHVELELEASFSLGGTLHTERGDWGGFIGERNLVVSARNGNLLMPLVRERALADGEWGPILVPLREADSYEVRLEGTPIAPQVRQFPPPSPGEHLRYDFVARKEGCELWFFVHEEGVDSQALMDAEVVVWWDQASPDSGPNFLTGTPRVDGVTYVGTFPPGRLFYEARAPGFAPYRGDLTVPADYALDLPLARGGRVAGRVSLGREPVRDFQLIYWQEGVASPIFSQPCLDRSEGEFAIDGLAVGEWRFQAATPESPPASPTSVEVRLGEPSEVAIELAPSLPGSGRVVDRQTGDPVTDAEVEVLGSGGVNAGLPWCSPFPCAEDGTFELSAFTPGSNFLVVRAPGYAQASVKKHLVGDHLDWGDIRITRPQTLVVELAGLAEFSGDVSGLQAYSLGPYELPAQRCDRSGRVHFESVPPGDLQLVFDEGPAEWSRLHLRLDAGQNWTFGHRIAGGKRLVVRVLDESGDVDLAAHSLLVSTVEPSGVLTVRGRGQPLAGEYSFEGIEATEAQVWIADSGSIVASRTVRLVEAITRVDLQLASELLRVHVLDPDEEPLAGAWVTLRSADGNHVLGTDDTDAEGWAELAGIPAERLLADVHHGTAGWRFGVPFDASLREQEFVLAAGGSIELQVTDGLEALADVTTRLETPGGTVLTRPRDTGADGRVRYAPLGEGRYRIVCRRSDCWTIATEVALTADTHARPSVILPRLAEVELLVRSAEGTPLAGVEVELLHRTLSGSAGDWLEAGLVQGSLQSTQDGHLTLSGLPSGAYTWRIAKPILAEGALVLAPGANELELRPVQ